MAHGGSNLTYSMLEELIKGVLPKCYDDEDGACFMVPPHSIGVIVYDNERESCMDSWVLLPGFNLLPKGLLVVIYLLFFIWLFQGISLCCDIFVEAIEVIISMKKTVKSKDPATGAITTTTEPVWNWVVANVSIMAVGASGPEIMLALVETILTLGQKPGELGPACIVGSATYNFFVITGVCTVSLAYGTTKKIEQYRVFVCTLLWSLWAHVWMYIVYEITSPHEITLWEAWLTLAFFPLTLLTAYITDVQPWKRNSQVSAMPLHEHGAVKELPAPPSQPTHHSILRYRMLAMRQMAGDTKVAQEMLALDGEGKASRIQKIPSFNSRADAAVKREKMAPAGCTKIGFTSLHYSVLESHGVATAVVRRYEGNIDKRCTIRYKTEDGTAVAGIDFEALEGIISFLPGETEREISVQIIDDDMAEPDVTFNITLSDAEGDNVFIVQESVTVTIVDDDDGGVITFELPTYEVSCLEECVDVPVVRRHGVSGTVTVEYATRPGTAHPHKHFLPVSGTLTMPKNEARVYIRVPLLAPEADMAYPKEYITEATGGQLGFKLVLSNPLGGAVLGNRTECRVLMTSANRKKHHAYQAKKIAGVDGELEEEEEPFELWSAWAEQYKEAMWPSLDENGNIWIQSLLRYVSITWCLIFAAMPPPRWKSGFPCFIVALGLLIPLLLILKEAIELFACLVGLSELMAGLSIVALGTSLPDTFASRMAAIHDDTADAAIGNITGSNAVNVFLGLGLPWVIASCYYASKGEKYVVDPGPLGFSLVLFCVFCCAGVVWLIYARFKVGGELGGSKFFQWGTFAGFFGMWLLFLILIGLNDKHHIHSSV